MASIVGAGRGPMSLVGVGRGLSGFRRTFASPDRATAWFLTRTNEPRRSQRFVRLKSCRRSSEKSGCAAVQTQTTYENFRYRADNRRNVYDQGCLNNFLEVFCTKIEPSRNNFHGYVQEEVPRPPKVPTRDAEADDSGGSRRAKVEDDLEIGDDILKLSHRHDFEEGGDVRSRGSDSLPRKSPDVELGLGLELQEPASLSGRHPSGRRNGS
ncbi:hypothetical protein Acr_24g0008400 [Actinidia rufa]|uniref:Uncharacterized protein n=1 Tax=Actinidia rufa TaxID=165716 RepID=A0A7J0GUX9_9ERIC|nr:hypothetical protein Acr_24g0008400 [Actinidia rufa]